MELTDKDIIYIAKLARFDLTGKELENIGGELRRIITYISKLGKLDLKGVEPYVWPVEKGLVPRDDEIMDSLKPEDAISNAPSTEGDFFTTPGIFKNE